MISMRKLICPCCGWSDFIKYDGEDIIYCLACGLEYTEKEELTFEKEVPGEDCDYGLTVIDPYEWEYRSFNDHKSDNYYKKWITMADSCAELIDESLEEKDEGIEKEGWQSLDGLSPFD